MNKLFMISILLCILIFGFSCNSKTELFNSKNDKIKVTVSINPQAYIVKKIGGERVSVNVMVPPAASPETYEPGPQKMVELANSSIYFMVGMPFEKELLKKIKNDYKNVTFSEMYKGIKFRNPESNHNHESSNTGEDDKKDPHIWLDPINLIKMAENTVSELIKADEAGRAFYVKNLVSLKQEIHSLHDKMVDLFNKSSGNSFVIYHPAWGYFADRYGLQQIPVEIEGKEPSASEMAKLTSFIKEKKVKYIFIQSLASENLLKYFESETDIQIRFIDPLKENVVENIEESASIIKEGIVHAKYH